MVGFLQRASEWKDLAWIIFTLVATVTSILSYLQVRKSVYQTLYNKITEEQILLCTNFLELLGNSEGDFLLNCDFENFLKFNIISHLVDKGFLEDVEGTDDIHDIYSEMIESDEIANLDLDSKLDKYDGFIITIIEKRNIPLEINKNDSPKRENIHEKFYIAQKFSILDNAGILLYTPKLSEVDNRLQTYMSNIYMPKQLIKASGKFYDRLLDLILKKAATIMKREEDHIYQGRKDEKIELNFTKLYNELMEDNKKLVKSYRILKKEIRKLLRIDKM